MRNHEFAGMITNLKKSNACITRPIRVNSCPFVVQILLFLFTIALHAEPETFVVDASKSGAFPSIQKAVDAAVAERSKSGVILSIAPGTYRERILIPTEIGDLILKGAGADSTKLVFNLAANSLKPDGTPVGTSNSASISFRCPTISASGITFENDFGQGSQALAVALNSNSGTFTNCRFLGWQDTLLLSSGKYSFEKCYIEGHVDFIFGAAAAYFRDCEIHSKSSGYITAASTPETQAFGFVFDHCRVTVAKLEKGTVFLGRPWRPYGSVTWLNCDMGKGISPDGWENWRKPENEKTARYAEYRSTGEGGKPEKRVKWSRQLDEKEAAAITKDAVLK